MGKKCQVVCITNGKKFESIEAAAKYAKAKRWTMNVKMSVAGGFVDSEGREYRRETPMKTKNNYRNTGKELKLIKKAYKMTGKKGSKPVDETTVNEVVENPNCVLEAALWGHIARICEEHGCWEEVSALLEALAVITDKKD